MVVRREAIEEAGLKIGDLIPIHTLLQSPGAMSETCALFLGRVDAAAADWCAERLPDLNTIAVELVAAPVAPRVIEPPGVHIGMDDPRVVANEFHDVDLATTWPGTINRLIGG